MAKQEKLKSVVFENARILFRNFAGVEGKFNAKGDRNFSLLLDDETAQAMAEDGWNVKYLKPREEGDTPQARIEVSVSYKGRPPRVVMITSKGKTNLDESMVDILDWVDIEIVDLIINPYAWEVNGRTGVKAYLSSAYITIREDELDRKYADVPETDSHGVEIEAEKTPF
jgi:hypothetical protein